MDHFDFFAEFLDLDLSLDLDEVEGDFRGSAEDEEGISLVLILG